MNLFDPVRIGTLEAKNHFLRSATYEGAATEDGRPTDKILSLYQDLARGGVGTILTSYTYIADYEQPAKNQLGIYSDSFIPDYQKVTDAVHALGSKIFMQIVHGSSHSQGYPDTARILGPSALVHPNSGLMPQEMTKDDIRAVVQLFADAAVRVKKAGFDGVQIHCAHGYLLSQFLDPNTNHRTDEFGGSAENRFRFAGECLSAIRQAVGKDYPILVKVNTNCAGEADEAYAQDILYFCRQFEALGADAIELSGYNWLGLGKKKVPTFYLDRAVQIRQAVSIPLILVGGVRGPETAQQILDAGIDFVSASRPFICQPDFVRHLEQGEDSPCVGCTKCLGNIWSKEGRRCIKHEIPAAFANNQA